MVLENLHEGHPGITGMQSLARLHVYWLSIDKDIETYVNCCNSCQESKSVYPKVPLYPWNAPTEPWALGWSEKIKS